ncbi:uncharacterized protein LOC128393466 [Panonychus citri]|uniref:uncharacterized protein LOC128390898 n=1 Tax=Panonychus citri TaxID=50023 RepID=UPI002307DA3F|nr:uncharacterized protein LOC128390898 [Panonychus citri]XP_053209625.1 uncharacterized protein LOC128393466 [Panonychus citri]
MVCLPAISRLIRQQSFSIRMISPLPLRFASDQSIGKLNEKKIDESVEILKGMIANFKRFSPRVGLFSPQIELNDEILNKQIKGLTNYQLHTMKYLFYLNWKYNAINFKAVEVTKNTDEGIIDIRWQMYGKPGWMLIFVVDLANSFNKKPEERRDDWEALEGTSTFYLDNDGKIYKQTLKLLKRGNYRDLIRLPAERKKETTPS